MISFRHASDYLPKVVEQQSENGLALASGPAETLRRIMEDGAGGAALQALKGIKTVAQIAREYRVHPNQVSQWKSEVSRCLPEVFENGPTVQIQEGEKEIERLERKVGQLTMELDWLKKKSRQLGL